MRIFSHGLCLCTIDKLPIELQNKIEELLKLKVFTVSNILELIGEVYHELIGNKEIIIPILIIMDEMQLTIPFFSKENPKQYKEISKSVGYYCYNQHGINQRTLQDKLCIIPVVAGTDKNLGFKLTEFVNFQFPLPPFSKEGIFSILKTKNISESWYNNKEKIRFWHSVGMIPRTLEFGITAIQNLNSNEIKSEEFLFSEVEKMIYSNYGKLETEFKKELLYFSFTGTSVEPFLGSNWYEKLYLEGIIYKDPNTDKLLLPYPYFNNVIEYQNSGIPSNLFPKLTSQYSWNLFEELIIYILYHKMKGSNLIKRKDKIFSFSF